MLSLDLVTEGTSAIITLSGELDMSTVEKLTEPANTSLLDPNTHTLVIDLHHVSFVDTTGLASLIDLHRLAQSEAKRFELRSIPPHVTRLLDLSGMGNYFPTSS